MESFKRQLAASGGNMRRVSEALRNGGRAMPTGSDASRGSTTDASRGAGSSAIGATRQLQRHQANQVELW